MYKIGECLYCHETKPLKNGVCVKCFVIFPFDGLDGLAEMFGIKKDDKNDNK